MKHVEEKSTYAMKASCYNCGTKFLVEIEKGNKAIYFGNCPYCGTKGRFSFFK